MTTSVVVQRSVVGDQTVHAIVTLTTEAEVDNPTLLFTQPAIFNRLCSLLNIKPWEYDLLSSALTFAGSQGFVEVYTFYVILSIKGIDVDLEALASSVFLVGGASGTILIPGPVGPTGPAGATGATGPYGPTGLRGATGLAGTNGIDGINGATGATGPMGPTGPQGFAGVTGPQGAVGPTGAAGFTYFEIPLLVATKSSTSSIYVPVTDKAINLTNFPPTLNGLTRVIKLRAMTSCSASTATTEIQLYDVTHGVAITGTTLDNSTAADKTVSTELVSAALTVGSSNGNIRSDAPATYRFQYRRTAGSSSEYAIVSGAYLEFTYQ